MGPSFITLDKEASMTAPQTGTERSVPLTSVASGAFTFSVARMTGTMKGPMKAPDGTEIPPTGKSFDVDFYTVARWDNGQIVEENLMYDLVTFMKQIGLSK